MASETDREEIEKLRRVVQVSIETTEAMTAIAEMSRHVSEASNRSQSIAAASEEMVASVRQIAANSEHAADDARIAEGAAHEGMQAAEQAVGTMRRIAVAVHDAATKVDRLAEASSQIGAIVNSIEAIAKQTNLLALNATIEAARAGEAGKGFAVVATEVKTLANQTARATVDIRKRIDDLRREMGEIVAAMEGGAKAVEDGERVIASTGEKMHTVSGQIGSVTHKMNEIAHILSQQSAASSEVAEGIHQIADMSAANYHEIGLVLAAMDRSDQAIKAQLEQFVGMKDDAAIITFGKSDHVSFKKRVLDGILGRIKLTSNELPDHHSCRLGKWYDGVTDPGMRSRPSFGKLVDPHAAVHAHGRKALLLKEKGDIDGAIGEVRQLAEASRGVLGLLETLAHEGER